MDAPPPSLTVVSPVAPVAMSTEKLLTVNEVAERLNVTVRWVRRAVFEGRLEVIKLGRLIRVPEQSVEALIAAGRINRRPVRGLDASPNCCRNAFATLGEQFPKP